MSARTACRIAGGILIGLALASLPFLQYGARTHRHATGHAHTHRH